MNRSGYGYSEPTDASRFLVNIPSELLEEEGLTRSGRRPKTAYRHPDRWENDRMASQELAQPHYQPGSRVLHPVWGEGMVLNTALQQDDEIVDIFFEGVGLKRVIASLAKLEGELLGGVCDPFTSWLMLRGLRTLAVRLDRHHATASTIAGLLESVYPTDF